MDIACNFGDCYNFIIMDEPTSSLDAIAEYEICGDLINLSEKRTVIIISHRLSSILDSDRIVVVDSGSVVESGTHQELMKKDGLYARMFNLQNNISFAEIARHECEDYYILGNDELYSDVRHTKPLDREIISAVLMAESIDCVIEIKRNQQGKPYYVPDKNHLLEYVDPCYCEDTPEMRKLRAFLKGNCDMSDEREAVVFEELLRGARLAAIQLADVFEYLDNLGVRLKSQRDVERFTALYNAFHNTTRMPCNRGYTPDEMMRVMPPKKGFKSLFLGPNIKKYLQTGEMDIEDFRKQILTMDLPSEAMRFDLLKQLADIKPSASQPEKQKKVGRNDPCPCGSGKIQAVLWEMTIPQAG